MINIPATKAILERDGGYTNNFPNRRERRKTMRQLRNPNSKKGWLKPTRIQHEWDAKWNCPKTIYHYETKK